MADLNALFTDVPLDRRRFAVVGHPIPYTLSPAIHSAALAAYGVNAVYRKIDVPPEIWPAFVSWAEALSGFNVTIPYKQRAMVFGNDGGFVGAVNTVYRKNNRWAATNTDIDGFWCDLVEQGIDVRGKRIAVLGAGGAARAVLAAFHSHDARPERVFLVNRTRDHAVSLAQEARAHLLNFPIAVPASSEEERAVRSTQVLINTTPQGQKAGDGSPVPFDWLTPGQEVYDLIYHWDTPLLREARRRSLRAVGGLGMLIHQAALAFDLWFGDELRNKNVKYTLENLRAVMRQAAEHALKEKETL